MASNLYELTEGIPKLMLTATPMQNSLFDLFGLIQFIDERIFYSKAVFSDRYIKNEQYEDLRHQVNAVLQRTLRKEVSDYIQFPERKEMTVDFELSLPEVELYMKINNYLKKEILFALPNSHRTLITSVIRKLLASSSMAVAETFRTLKNRLVILKETTREESVEESLDFFFSFFDDDEVEDEQENDNVDQLYTREKVNEFIQHEIDEIDDIINTAEKIKKNAKMTALKTAVRKAFDFQRDAGIKEKVVIFTESVRTQQYIFEELSEEGYQGQILKFNGSSGDDTTKELFRAWRNRNYGKYFGSRNVELKNAIVQAFKEDYKILLVTDSGSEGLNLQFCNTIINYDLPWNPQKIEQRIGRCHRYGQKNDVVVFNLLNTQNVADKRVYEILSNKFELFKGVFGASDRAIGLLESGADFEKRVSHIYQECKTSKDFSKEFTSLERELDRKRNKKIEQLKSLIIREAPEQHKETFERILSDIQGYQNQRDYWEKVNLSHKQVIYPRFYRCKRLFDIREELKNTNYLENYKQHQGSASCPDCHYSAYPARFISICEDGHMDDFPWRWWCHNGKTDCKEKLRLKSFGTTSSLAELEVECDCGAKRRMSGSMQKENFDGCNCTGNHPQRPNAIKKICKKKIVPSQRGASNVYFPVTRTAISIPPWTNPINDLMAEHRRDIDLLIEVLGRDAGLNKSYEKYFEGKFTRDEFNEAYNRLEQNIKDYVELKEMEYNAITHHQQVEFQHDVRYFKAEEVAIKDSLKKYFSRVIKLHRLREVKVLLGYSRLEMPEPEVDDQKQVVKLKSSGPEKWLPAVEINGEGIFIEFNRATMNEWLTNSRVAERSKKYESCYEEYRYKSFPTWG